MHITNSYSKCIKTLVLVLLAVVLLPFAATADTIDFDSAELTQLAVGSSANFNGGTFKAYEVNVEEAEEGVEEV